ncbi:MAG: D-aminoacylase [Betaproteobacteria bacterium]|nr:D-aminoacylase [Betaproteobacteria bacterium]
MSEHYDLILRGGTVVDGTRAARFRADLGVRGERIAAIGDLSRDRADRELDASGKIVAPGFIDAHTHDDRLMLSAPEMAPKASQGVTTVIAGNCGVSLAPLVLGERAAPPPLDLIGDTTAYRYPSFRAFVEELEARPAATNGALLVGHSTLRVAAMDTLERSASAAEIDRMRAMVSEALEAGAIGCSTGLYYEPARAATTEEVIEVCRPLSARKALYCTHMRDEGDRIMDSLEETFRIGKALAVPVVVSHHKVAGRPNFGRMQETLPFIAERMKDQPIGLDCYPYCASSTILSWSRTWVAMKVLITWSKPHPEFNGMDLEDVAAKMGLSKEDTVQKLLPAGAIYFSMDENDVQRVLVFEHSMVGSDGLPHDAAPHPRLWGTFPRVLGHYSRGLGLFPLETAVYKMTGLTAKTFGLEGRGVLKAGNFADLCVFDAGTVDEAATFARPIQPAKGIEAVIVNGRFTWRDGKATGERPGRVLRRSAA